MSFYHFDIFLDLIYYYFVYNVCMYILQRLTFRDFKVSSLTSYARQPQSMANVLRGKPVLCLSPFLIAGFYLLITMILLKTLLCLSILTSSLLSYSRTLQRPCVWGPPIFQSVVPDSHEQQKFC